VIADPGASLPATAEQLLGRLADLAATAIARAEARDRLLTEATTDALTGLANHRVFERRLAEETARAQRYHRPIAVALIDVDDFKSINDSEGHLAGDAALAEVARRIAAVTRGDALLARIGGDEFGLLLPECDDIQAVAAAERARRAVVAEPVGDYLRVSVSIGVAETSQCAAHDALRRCADIALYAAKLEGGNSTVRYTPALSADRHGLLRARKLAGLRSLAHAIDARDPDTAEHSKRVAGIATALARECGWDPDRIELLREAALVHDVGKIGVPDEILLARRPLEPEEYEQVKQHAALGAQLAADVLSREQTQWIRWHHERADGSGYPDGLHGEDLPEGAKLLAVADAWDAMTTSRRYSRAQPAEVALAECRRLAGAQFDPDAIAALVALAGSQKLVRT
jgi:diguanylate cyclase (GGDEF)-like protein/putative nucleotidyltransferase with HDIG domain